MKKKSAKPTKDELLELYEKTLYSIACFGDTTAEENLSSTGKYSTFDEPCSVSEAREALKIGDKLKKKLLRKK